MPAVAKVAGVRRDTVRNRTSALGYLQLTRPANLITAAADILAGAAIGRSWSPALALLVPAGMCLYAGGVVFNDVFDRDLDAVERPERPIPSGRASVRGAALLAGLLLLAGIVLAFENSGLSGFIAVATAVSALVYDRISKHNRVAGPINMGLCRGLNLLLGISAAGVIPPELYIIPLIPVLYIGAVTFLSAGEVHGGSRANAMSALLAVGAVITLVPLLAVSSGTVALWSIPFLALLAVRVLRPLWRAYQNPEPKRIFAAVKAGVLSLIILNSAIAAAWMGPVQGVVILLLMPVAALLARTFAVT